MNSSESMQRPPLSEWLIAGLIVGNLYWTTLCLGGYRPETMVWTWSITAITAMIQLSVIAFSSERIHRASWILVPFLAYAAWNVVFVSPVPWLGWRDWLGWTHAFVVFWLLLNGTRHRTPRFFIFSSVLALALIAVVLAAYQHFLWPDWLTMGRKQAPQFYGRSSGPFGIPNSLAAFFLLLIPPMAMLTLQRSVGSFQRILFGYFCAVFLLGLGLTISRGAWISLVAVVAIWPLSLKGRSWEWRVSASIGALTCILIACAAAYTAVPRVKLRFDQLASDAGEHTRPIMWRAAWRLFESAPLVGTGAGSYNTLFERYRPSGFHDEPQWVHNDYLNTLSDYGVIGFVLSFGGGGVILLRSICHARAIVPPEPHSFFARFYGRGVTRSIGLGLIAFALSLLVDFHLKIPALGMLSSIMAAECVLRSWPPEANATPKPWAQSGILAGILAVAFLLLGIALPSYRGESFRYAARGEIDRLAAEKSPTLNRTRSVLSSAAAKLSDAVSIDPSNAQTLSDEAYVAALWARVSPERANELGRTAEATVRKALAFSQFVPEFWIRLGVSLDLQGRWGEANAAFAQAVHLAPSNAIVWYYDAYHLTLTRATRPMAQAAVRQSLLLDPGFVPAIELQHSLSSGH